MAIPSPTAFSPGSVTCFFVPAVGASLADTSSPGCGINISQGVTAAVGLATSVTIRLNGMAIEFPPVRMVVDELAPEPVEVFLETPLPLGCGFGVSAASALATALALARRFDLEKSRQELATVALNAEIHHRTGIGDVPAQILGGVVLRRWRTGAFDAESLAVADVPLYCRVFGPLSTRDVLGNPEQLRRIAEHGKMALAWLEEHRQNIRLEQLLARSLEFAQAAGLVTDPRVVQALAEVQTGGGQGTMVMLGQSVLASRPGREPSAWQEYRIDFQGTRYLP